MKASEAYLSGAFNSSSSKMMENGQRKITIVSDKNLIGTFVGEFDDSGKLIAVKKDSDMKPII